MTRYAGTNAWLDVDQQNVAVGSSASPTAMVLPLSSLTQAQINSSQDGGGVLTMMFAATAQPGGLVVPPERVDVAFDAQAGPGFQALAGWLAQVVTVNRQAVQTRAAPAPARTSPGSQAVVAASSRPAADALPVVNPNGVQLLLKPGEVVHGVFQAELLKQEVQREYQGGAAGLSFPLGHGVRLRTGGMRGHSVVVGTHAAVQDTGQLVVTSTRTVFIGHQRSLEFLYAKLIGLREYTDGLGLSVSNRQTTSVFRLAGKDSPDLAVSLISRSAS
ncbi:MAG: hypothetical protein FWF36_02120 [Propionibacteriaceae bacterium]|nr:hypothetical protein [Propionibacteriaceae bacterium]